MRLFAIAASAACSLLLVTASCFAGETKPHIDTSGVNLQPAYPASAYGTREAGVVVLAVAVAPDGNVSRIRLMQTSSFNDIDSAAIAGVMGWKFVPATRDGVNVDGVTSIRLLFQPPDQPTSATAPTPTQPINYLAPSIELTAGRGQFSSVTKSVPCANGRIDVTLQFEHGIGRIQSLPWTTDRPFASLDLMAGDDVASVKMTDEEYYSPPVEDFAFERTIGKETAPSVLAYSFVGQFGSRQTVSIAWNAFGLVTGRVGAMQTRQTQIPSPPTAFRLRASAAAARFLDAELVCFPGPKEN